MPQPVLSVVGELIGSMTQEVGIEALSKAFFQRPGETQLDSTGVTKRAVNRTTGKVVVSHSQIYLQLVLQSRYI